MSSPAHVAAAFVLILLTLSAPARAADSTIALATATRHGTASPIVFAQPCNVPFESYEEWLVFVRKRRTARGDSFDETQFRRDNPAEIFAQLQSGGIECLAIVYPSDGIEVEGFVVRPRGTSGRPPPAIIFNRGGNRDFGRLVFANLMDFASWAQEGFLVLASQYRGNGGSGGRDEFGGADVDDVLNLIPVARHYGADMDNLFMAGFSRGGMMTFLSMKHGARLRAAAVIGGAADLTDLGSERQEMVAVYRELMPDFDRNAEQLLRDRSAVHFAEQLDAPLLIMHGGADRRVPPGQALALAMRLQQAHKPYELVVFAGEDHALEKHQAECRQRLLAWFKRHLQ